MRMLAKIWQLPAENWLLFIVTIINRMGSMALFFLILYLHKQLHLSVQMGGIIISFYGAGALLAGPIGGILSDRLGACRVMFLALLFSGLIMLFYPLIHTFFLLALMTFIWGLVGESYRPASQVIINHFCTPEQRKTAYALNRLAINLGMSIGPVVGGFLASSYFKAIFVVDGITTLIAALFLLWKLYPYIASPNLVQTVNSAIWGPLKTAVLDPKMIYVMLAFVCIMAVFFQQNSTLPVFMVQDLHVPISTFGLICSINTILIVFFELPLNIFIANCSHKMTLCIGAIFIATGFGFYLLVHTILGIIVGLIIWTIGEMVLFPAMSAYIIDIAPADKRGIYMGIYTMGLNIALVVGPALGTRLLESTGAHALWTVCFIVGIVAAWIFLRAATDRMLLRPQDVVLSEATSKH